MGILIFWIQYIIAFILLYHVLRCIYERNTNIRLKSPLYLIILLTLATFIPFVNIIILIGRLVHLCSSYRYYDKPDYYCKSIFTKEY
jgi:hypothetical protein